MTGYRIRPLACAIAAGWGTNTQVHALGDGAVWIADQVAAGVIRTDGAGHLGRMGRARAMPILKRRGGRMGIALALPILRAVGL